jgi:hypothetical protein
MIFYNSKWGDMFGVHPMRNLGAYDPATLEVLRTVLDEAWDALPSCHKKQISKLQLADVC